MSSTAVGLLGVIGGATIAGGLQLARDLRADRRAKQSAVRQIYADLRLAIARLKAVEALERVHVGVTPEEYDLPDASWLVHGTVAAGLVDAKTWSVLVSSVMGIQSVNRMFAGMRAEDEPRYVLDAEELNEIRRIRAYLEYARHRVDALQRGRWPGRRPEPQLVILRADTPERLTTALAVLRPALERRGWRLPDAPRAPTWTEVELTGRYDVAVPRLQEVVDEHRDVAGLVRVLRRHPGREGS